jgi:hypothetical protein
MTDYTINIDETESPSVDAGTMACGMISFHIFGFSATVLCIIFGILALVPSSPFSETNIGLGVSMIVLSIFSLIYVVAGIVGVCFGYCIQQICCCH